LQYVKVKKKHINFGSSKTPNDMLQIKISDAEIQRLNYERYYYPIPLIQKRIHAVYYKSLGKSNNEIGVLTSLNRETVGDWVRIYLENGFEALCRLNYGTNKSELENHAVSILSSFTERPPMSTNEAKSRIEELTGISRSPSQVRSFMKRNKLRYIKTGHIPAKADTEKQQQWVKTILEPAIAEAQKGECHLLFMDAAHFILEPFVCAMWCLTRFFVKASAGRNRINVLGVVNAITKEILTYNNTSYINAGTIVSFFEKLRVHYGDMPIKIVLDNARYQHCKLVEEAAKTLGISLLFLTSYSPNLNIIERLWKFTKKKILYAKYYDTPAKFHLAITAFFQTVNQKHHAELENLLTLKFQFFQNQNAVIYPV